MYGSHSSTSRNVPCRPCLPADLGNISYHAPYRARCGSTVTSTCRPYVTDRLRSACRSISTARSDPRAAVAAALPLPSGGALDEARRHLQLLVHVLSGLDAFGELAAPGLEGVDPGLDREAVPSQLGDRELGPPAVVAQRDHRHLGPVRLAVVPVPDDASERVLTVGDDVRLDGHLLARGSPGRKPPGVDFGRDRLDGDPSPAIDVRLGEAGRLSRGRRSFQRSASHG